MKRKSIYFFVLIFWLLAVCTVLSENIERLMTARVVVYEGAHQSMVGQGDAELTLEALTRDASGNHLYEIVKGSGWESGNRVEETDSHFYTVEKECVLITSGMGGKYILYASKEITPGDLVQKVTPYKGKNEKYLVIAPVGTETVTMDWEDTELLEQKGNILLISQTGKLPYMEGMMRDTINLTKESKIYCLGEVKEFFENMPLLSVIWVLLMFSVVLWGYSYKLMSNPPENRVLLAGNLGIGLLLFWGFTNVTQRVSLPSSLLPKENILDLTYYKNVFIEIWKALEGMSSTAAVELKEVFFKSIGFAGGVIGFGIVCEVFILLWEHRFAKKLSQKNKAATFSFLC